MIAEVIAIGDELTSGQRLDTNSQWLSQRLHELGISVLRHATVADDLASMVEAFGNAARRCDVVLVTGGLGPTADDLTRQAIAATAGAELVLDQAALDEIRAMFESRGREMPASNEVQAMFPAGSLSIQNPHGTAPGIDIRLPRDDGQTCRVFALPGVPAEMHEMWEQTVAEAILSSGGGRRVIRHRVIKCFGAGESQMETMLPDLIRRGREPQVGITASRATISLRITASGDTASACDAQIEPTVATIRECLGSLVFGEGDDELQHAVIRLLREGNQTLATIECGTSGRLAHWLSELPDAVGVYRGGIVSAAETDPQYVQNGRLLAENGAGGCREQFGADFGLAIGPIPTGDPSEPAEFFYALATDKQVFVKSSTTAGHPAILKDRAAKQALNLLRLHLIPT